MAKQAFLVSFSPMTRVVVDVENSEELTDDEELKIIKAAREQMMVDSIADYLNAETVDLLELDTECPYGTFDFDELM